MISNKSTKKALYPQSMNSIFMERENFTLNKIFFNKDQSSHFKNCIPLQ